MVRTIYHYIDMDMELNYTAYASARTQILHPARFGLFFICWPLLWFAKKVIIDWLMDFFSLLKVNFKYLLFNSVITKRSFENCSYLSSCLLPQWRIFRRILYWSVALNQTLILQKYWGTSSNLFYGLEAYSPLLSKSMPKNKRNVSWEIFKTSVCFLSMTIQLGIANNHIS